MAILGEYAILSWGMQSFFLIDKRKQQQIQLKFSQPIGVTAGKAQKTNRGEFGHEKASGKKLDLPSWEYIPDGEPYVFGDRVYVYGSHDRFNGHVFCLGDYMGWSAPVNDLSDWRCEGVIYPSGIATPSMPTGK